MLVARLQTLRILQLLLAQCKRVCFVQLQTLIMAFAREMARLVFAFAAYVAFNHHRVLASS